MMMMMMFDHNRKRIYELIIEAGLKPHFPSQPIGIIMPRRNRKNQVQVSKGLPILRANLSLNKQALI